MNILIIGSSGLLAHKVYLLFKDADDILYHMYHDRSTQPKSFCRQTCNIYVKVSKMNRDAIKEYTTTWTI